MAFLVFFAKFTCKCLMKEECDRASDAEHYRLLGINQNAIAPAMRSIINFGDELKCDRASDA